MQDNHEMNQMYRIYNLTAWRYGRPFVMCSRHAKTYNPPVLRDGRGRLQHLGPSLSPCTWCRNEEIMSSQNKGLRFVMGTDAKVGDMVEVGLEGKLIRAPLSRALEKGIRCIVCGSACYVSITYARNPVIAEYQVKCISETCGATGPKRESEAASIESYKALQERTTIQGIGTLIKSFLDEFKDDIK